MARTLPLLPTSLVGSYPQPEWLIDRKKLAGRFPTRVRARELWRIAPEWLDEENENRFTGATPAGKDSMRCLTKNKSIPVPTPPQIDFDAALLALDPAKDVDGLHPVNMGRLALGMPGPVPCTDLKARPNASAEP